MLLTVGSAFMCSRCGSYGRWKLDGEQLCNGCLMAELQELYSKAGGYVERLDGITGRSSMWEVRRP